MKDVSKGKIFLAAERGRTEIDWFRSYNTFNFGGYQTEHKKPFGKLYVLNDDTLAGRKTFRLTVEEDSGILLMPVVGAVEYSDDKGNNCLLQAGQTFFSIASKGTNVQLCNPYEEELVNYLQAWFTPPGLSNSMPSLLSFDLNEKQNSLAEVMNPQRGIRCFTGKFDGRSEGTINASAEDSRFFVFVIQGAFEVQNRLLETRDGLALWDADEVEFEALSNEAIILVIEMYGQ